MKNLLIAALNDDAGQGLVEYALIIALTAIAAITALRFLASKANGSFSNSASQLS